VDSPGLTLDAGTVPQSNGRDAIGLTVLEWIVQRSGLLGESPQKQRFRFPLGMPIANLFDFLL
jgi:hypothetical protein